MTRRAFVAASLSPALVPMGLDSSSCEPARSGLYELRIYRTSSRAESRVLAARFREISPRAGIHPVFEDYEAQDTNAASVRYLIRFDDEAARNRSWTELTADPQWKGARFRSYQFRLFRVA